MSSKEIAPNDERTTRRSKRTKIPSQDTCRYMCHSRAHDQPKTTQQTPPQEPVQHRCNQVYRTKRPVGTTAHVDSSTASMDLEPHLLARGVAKVVRPAVVPDVVGDIFPENLVGINVRVRNVGPGRARDIRVGNEAADKVFGHGLAKQLNLELFRQSPVSHINT